MDNPYCSCKLTLPSVDLLIRLSRGIGDAGPPWDAPAMPTNLYGASKCWAEALARVPSAIADTRSRTKEMLSAIADTRSRTKKMTGCRPPLPTLGAALKRRCDPVHSACMPSLWLDSRPLRLHAISLVGDSRAGQLPKVRDAGCVPPTRAVFSEKVQ